MGMGELVIILAIFVLLFGAKRLPDLADGMGKAIRNFKRGLTSPDEDVTPVEKQVPESSSASRLETKNAQSESQPVEPKS